MIITTGNFFDDFMEYYCEGEFGIYIRKRVSGAPSELTSVMRYLWNADATPSRRLFASSDSILEIPTWYVFCVAPRSVAMQLETHKKKHGFYLWMSSARPDRDSEAAKSYSREQPVRFVMKITSRAIIDISHYRMCEKAERPTRMFMVSLRKAMFKSAREHNDLQLCFTAEQMMPMCAYRNGLCTEIRGCGNPKRYGSYAPTETESHAQAETRQ